MAGAPKFKIYDSHGKYQAAVKELEAAACLVSFYGPGASVREGHRQRDVLWVETEQSPADESYDETAAYMQRRRCALYDQHGWRKCPFNRQGPDCDESIPCACIED